MDQRPSGFDGLMLLAAVLTPVIVVLVVLLR